MVIHTGFGPGLITTCTGLVLPVLHLSQSRKTTIITNEYDKS